MITNPRVKNAISINVHRLMDSVGIKLILLICFSISLLISVGDKIVAFLILNRVNQINTEDIRFYCVTLICALLMLFTVLIITRSGVQVGYQKGNKVTEVILTSITRTQLYIAYIIANYEVLVICLSIVSLPIVVRGIIQSMNFEVYMGFITARMVIFIVLHILLSAMVLVILATTLASTVRRSEDTGMCMLIILLPVIASHLYYTLVGNIYKGILFPLNYISITSLIPSVGACLNSKLPTFMQITILVSDIICIFVSLVTGVEFFNDNIIEN